MGRLLAKIVYPDAKTFKDLLSVLSSFLDEVSIVITSDGVRIAGTSPHKTSFLETTIPRQALFTIEVSGSVRAGADLRALSLIPRGKKGTPLEIAVYEDEIELVMERPISSRLKIMNIELTEEGEDISVRPVALAFLMADPLRKIVSDIRAISDNIEISLDESSISFSAVGEKSKVVSKLTRGSAALLDLQVRQSVKGAYEASALEQVLKTSRIMETAELGVGGEGQLELKVKAAEGTLLRFITTPIA